MTSSASDPAAFADTSFFDTVTIPEAETAPEPAKSAHPKGWKEVEPGRFQNPQLITPHQFHNGYYQAHKLLGNLTGLETLKILEDEEHDFANVSDEVYWTIAQVEQLHFILDKDAAWMQGLLKALIVIGGFYLGKFRMVKAEVAIIREQKRAKIEAMRNKKTSYGNDSAKTPTHAPVHADKPNRNDSAKSSGPVNPNDREYTPAELQAAADRFKALEGGMFV